MPQTFESPIFVHYNPLYEPSDLEISAYIVDEAQVHAHSMSSVESPYYVTWSLLPLTTLTHGHVDACDFLLLVGHIMTYVDLCHDICNRLSFFSFCLLFLWLFIM